MGYLKALAIFIIAFSIPCIYYLCVHGLAALLGGY